jgi:hypothetical protein
MIVAGIAGYSIALCCPNPDDVGSAGAYLRGVVRDPRVIIPVLMAIYLVIRIERVASYYTARGEAGESESRMIDLLAAMDLESKGENKANFEALSEKLDAIERRLPTK